MNTRRAACITLLVAAVATGCSSNSDDAKAPVTPTPSTAPTSPSATATTDAPSGPLKFGAAHHWTGTDPEGRPVSGTTTAISYTQPATGVDLPDEAADFEDSVWAVLEVKVCADKNSNTLIVSQAPWALGFPDDTRLQAPSLTGGGVPKPEYPATEGTVKAGTCVRGKITFSVEDGTRPNQVIYAPAEQEPVEWAVPKA
ncbi:hypothetical protein [Streptomyces hirsutus]|uniref:hypothetical protein n=1 Tax=Streptomyces hirsutus TaxID=35620 RepID=UPI003318FE80